VGREGNMSFGCIQHQLIEHIYITPQNPTPHKILDFI